MKMQRSFSVFFLTALLFFQSVSVAQDIHFNLITRSKDDPGGAILSITQDPQGFLWFSTENGLYKYDGYQYSAYHYEPLNPNSPAADNIWNILADKSGYIWLTPSRSGLDRLDPATGVFTHFRHNDKDPRSLASDTLFSVMQDHEGTLWIGTRSGLDRFDSKTNTFSHYRHDPADPYSLSCNTVMTLYEDKHQSIWIGTGATNEDNNGCGGLNQFNKKTGKFIRYLHDERDPHSLIDNRIRAILEDSRGNFWVGTAGDGLHMMDRTKGTFERHLYDPLHPGKLSRPPVKKIRSFPDDFISFLKEDSKGRIWIGTLEGGINVYDPSTKQCTYYGTDKNSKEKLTNNEFTAACKTTDNTLWICGAGWINGNKGNLYKIIPYKNSISHVRIGKVVRSFAEDRAGALWIGTEKGLVHRYVNGKEEQFLIDKDPSSPSNIIQYIEKVDDKLWLATGGGLYLFAPVTRTFSGYHHQPGNDSSLISDTVFVIKKASGNNLWIGSMGGLDLMDTKSGKFKHFPDKLNTGSTNNNYLITIDLDKQRNVWVGHGNGLKRLDQHTQRFKKYLNNIIVLGRFEDREGNIWCGTTAGIFKYDKVKDDFLSFTDETGIINKSIPMSVTTEDHEGNLWIQSAKGLIRLNKERKIGVLYGKNQGADPAVFNSPGYVKPNGEILYGDTSGYIVVSPDFLRQNGSPPAVTITNFLLNNEPVQPSANGTLTAPLPQTKEILLKHNQNTFSFEFANIDFLSAHEDTRLLYTLQNYDNTWRKAGDERTAYYFNLPPGGYIFKVKAFNAAGFAVEKSIAITIRPPWWITWWAYIFYALIIGNTIYILYYNRINQLKTKQAAQMNIMVATQEGERKRISRELHDSVGIKLSALKLFLSMLHEKAINKNDDEIKSLAESSAQFITEVMQDVRQLLLNLSPAILEEFGYRIAIEGLVNKINETKQVHFSLVIFGMERPLPKDVELALYRTTQELINNVLKHAEAKDVVLQIGRRDEKIILMIEDDGKGFDINAHRDGYGLKNLEARTKLMRGTMTIDSQTGKGTSVLIEIPDNFN
jgi:signal transduction histidine kinase/ligand-binding sensor domain-containing protein